VDDGMSNDRNKQKMKHQHNKSTGPRAQAPPPYRGQPNRPRGSGLHSSSSSPRRERRLETRRDPALAPDARETLRARVFRSKCGASPEGPPSA